MSRISISRGHKLSHSDAMKVVRAIADQLQREYGISSRWSESALHFSRSGLTGSVHLEPERLRVEVELGFLLAAFRDQVTAGIEKKLDEELAPKPAKTVRKSAK